MFGFKLASLLAFASLVVAQADPSINTPAAVVQCQPVQISWTATKEPVFISIIPGNQAGAAPLKDFGQQPAGTKVLTWKVDVKGGTSITCQIRDAAGAVAYSAAVTVQDSADSSCLDPNQPQPSSTRATGGTSTRAGTASAPGSTAPSNTRSSGASATAPAGSTRTAAATTAQPTSSAQASNAARAGTVVQFGWTGMMGLFVAGFAAA